MKTPQAIAEKKGYTVHPNAQLTRREAKRLRASDSDDSYAEYWDNTGLPIVGFGIACFGAIGLITAILVFNDGGIPEFIAGLTVIILSLAAAPLAVEGVWRLGIAPRHAHTLRLIAEGRIIPTSTRPAIERIHTARDRILEADAGHIEYDILRDLNYLEWEISTLDYEKKQLKNFTSASLSPEENEAINAGLAETATTLILLNERVDTIANQIALLPTLSSNSSQIRRANLLARHALDTRATEVGAESLPLLTVYTEALEGYETR